VLELGEPVDVAAVPELDRLFRVAALCNEADLHHRDGGWIWRGDPTDVALLTAAYKAGWKREAALDRFPLVRQIPFESERRYATTVHRAESGLELLVKGAPEQVLEMCADFGAGGRVEALHQANRLAELGYRVLALAEGELPAERRRPPPAAVPFVEPSGLRFLGLVGMIDPPRPGVRDAIARCRGAGVEVSMVTGDHPVTALAISRDLGLADRMDEVISGADLARLTDDELDEAVRRVRVFARVSPDQKLRIVNAIRRGDQFVAVTGDGVNDAPALRNANIGVAMGRGGTDVARDAADIVLSDDNFATIVAGIEEGRIAYANIRKVIYLLISTGAAEVVMVGLAVAFGMPIPLLPVQLLWLNLVTNGIQDVALALEPGEGDELNAPPRPPRERIFNRLMIERTVIAAAYMGLRRRRRLPVDAQRRLGRRRRPQRRPAALRALRERPHRQRPRRSPLLAPALAAAQPHPARRRRRRAPASSRGDVFPPAGKILGAAPVDLPTAAVLAALALGLFVLMELQKWTWRRRNPRAR
jgi:P-type Ca2+ transporter type 2C